MPDTPSYDAIILGAGMSGLAAAVELDQQGYRTALVDQSQEVGGRVATEAYEGFLLDRGFQVLLTAYPEAKRLLDYEQLELQHFPRGATVLTPNGQIDVTDPRESMTAAIKSLGTIFHAADLPAIWRLSRVSGSPLTNGGATADYLREAGFSPSMREFFLEPFLRGILLDPDLNAPIERVSFYMEMFAKGYTAIPAGGIKQIPLSLAAKTSNCDMRLGRQVTAIEPGRLRFADGDAISADALLVALDASGAAGLIGQPCPAHFFQTACHYFDVPEAELAGLLPLVLNGRDSGPINHCAIPSAVSSAYAPAGRALLGANTIGDKASCSVDEVVSQLADWFGPAANSWQLLKTVRVPAALPSQAEEGAWHRFADLVETTAGLAFAGPTAVAGDYTATASLNGAMASGAKAAGRLANALGQRVADD